MSYFNDFVGNFFVFTLLLYLTFTALDGLLGFRDFFNPRLKD